MQYRFSKAHRPALAWALLILILTLAPGKFIPKVDYWSIVSLDKYVHAGIFFMQVILLLYGLKQLRLLTLKNYIICTGIGVAYGVLIEVIQQFIPLRSFEWNDMLANTVGALLALLSFYCFEKVRPKNYT